MLFGKLLAIVRQVFFREFSGGCEMKYYSFLQGVEVELYCVGGVGLNERNKIQHNIKSFAWVIFILMKKSPAPDWKCGEAVVCLQTMKHWKAGLRYPFAPRKC